MGLLDFIYTGVIAHFLKKRLGGSGHHSAHDHHDHAHEHHGDHDDYDQDGYGEHDDYGEHDLDGWYGDEY